MRRGADGQQVNHHQFTEMLPPRFQESSFRMPAHGEGASTVEHLRPVDALVNLCCEVPDFLVCKILTRGQDSAQQNGGINGRKFAFLPATTSFHVHKMKKEPMLVGHIIGQKSQRTTDALENLRRRSIATPVADAEARQSKPCRRDARHGSRIVAVGKSPVFYLPRLGARFIPEKLKARALNFV